MVARPHADPDGKALNPRFLGTLRGALPLYILLRRFSAHASPLALNLRGLLVVRGPRRDESAPPPKRRDPSLLDAPRQPGPPRFPGARVVLLLVVLGAGVTPVSAAERADLQFEELVRPMLEDRCFACHGNGIKKGGVDLEGARAEDQKLWGAVLKNVRSGIMPPADKPRPTNAELARLESWIKFVALGIDPTDPDPGRVTVRRLNRVEYRNTIRDLIGVDFDTTTEFPADDTGHGFDNIGEVLTLSPLLLEKYLTAARTIIERAVPMVPKIVAERVIAGRDFLPEGVGAVLRRARAGRRIADCRTTSRRPSRPASWSSRTAAYRLVLDLTANERFVDGVSDYNRCRLTFRADGEELLRHEFVRQDGTAFHFEVARDWKAGPHDLSIEVQPLTPDEKQVRSLTLRIQSVDRARAAGRAVLGPAAELRPLLPRRGARRPRRPPTLCARAPRQFRRAGVPAPRGRRDQGPARGPGRGRLGPAGARPSRRAWRRHGGRPDLAPVPLPRGVGRARRHRSLSLGRRIQPGLAALVLPLVVDARRRADPPGRRARKLRANLRTQVDRMLADSRSEELSATSSASGSRPATSKRCRSTPPPWSRATSRRTPPRSSAGRGSANSCRKPADELTDRREARAADRPRDRSAVRSADSASSS